MSMCTCGSAGPCVMAKPKPQHPTGITCETCSDGVTVEHAAEREPDPARTRAPHEHGPRVNPPWGQR